MIKLDNYNVLGFDNAIRGMRNPMNSWEKSDSYYNDNGFYTIGEADHNLMMRLANGGPVHAKYRRMIVVYVDITAPLYWWKEFDTYKVGTVSNSCSTMHKIAAKEFEPIDFSHEHLDDASYAVLSTTIAALNVARDNYLSSGSTRLKNKDYWWQMIQLLPSSYNQKRTIMMDYEVLSNIYFSRQNHTLDEWRKFCDWIRELPCSEVITLKEK